MKNYRKCGVDCPEIVLPVEFVEWGERKTMGTKKPSLLKQLAQRCYHDPDFRTSLDRQGLTECQMKRVLGLFAQLSEGLWPHNSARAHRYALRKMAQMGDEFVLEVYEGLVSEYVNNSKNW